ncbi:MAG: T9SS type A sorting domain-containing protein [Bacteroidetes bacterium]|nr:T9SS type A sorting domain-containing protein [Bacteroidota bacterium]
MNTLYKRITLLLLCWLPAQTILLAQPCREVVGYYPNWQWYDRNKLVNPSSIDYSKYTIINYCFFNPQPNGDIVTGDSWADENLLMGQINWSTTPPSYYPNTSIVDLAHNNNVKVLISVGGWTWSNNFPSIAANPTTRAAFAHSCNELVRQYNLDGIDLDWEYPGYAPHNGGPADAANFTLLLQQVRDSLNALELVNNEQYLLTAAVGASAANMSNVQWAAVTPLLDMINLMSYDFFGAWDAVANHNSPLNAPACGDPGFNISTAFTQLTQQYGVPANKINVGVAFYGRSQTGFTGLCQATSGNAATTAFPPDGVPLYYEIAAQQSQYTFNWDNQAQVPWLNNSNGVFLSYDNEQSIALKAQFVVSNGARGAIIWEITGDYLETAPGSGVIAGTPLADTLNAVFCASPLGAQVLATATQCQLAPNPANNLVNIMPAPTSPATVRIFTATGALIENQLLPAGANTLNINNLSTGVYLLSIETAEGISWQKLIKN